MTHSAHEEGRVKKKDGNQYGGKSASTHTTKKRRSGPFATTRHQTIPLATLTSDVIHGQKREKSW